MDELRRRTDRELAPALLVLPLLLALAAFVLSGCGAAAQTAEAGNDGPPKHGGEIVLGMDQEPPGINPALVCCSMSAAVNMVDPVWDNFLDIDPKGQYFPVMAERVPTVENGLVEIDGQRMTVTLEIREEAAWNDGKPVTCADWKFTWETYMNPKWTIGARNGWDKIETVECPSPKRAVTVFKEPYAPYLRIVGAPPWPKHALQGKDFNTYMMDRIGVSSGPFVFDYWKRNVEYVLKRNPNYWNKGKNDLPYLDSIKYRFLKDTNTLKIQLRTGEVDWILAVPDTNLREELEAFPRSDFQSTPGGYWEQFAFNLDKPQLRDVNVRRAIAHLIDREQLSEVVLKGQTEPLHSTLLPQAEEYYLPAWQEYDFNADKAARYMEKAGYTRDGRWWMKDGKPLTLLFKSTAGNALRMKVAQLLQQAFKKNGIQMEIALEDPGVFFGQSTVQGSYDVAVWAWSSTVLSDQTTLFACDQIPTKANKFQGSNNYRYCNEQVTKLLYAADVTPDTVERARQIHEIQRLMAKDMPMLPLYQRPETVAYSKRLKGVSNNPLGGVPWNVHEWWVTDA